MRNSPSVSARLSLFAALVLPLALASCDDATTDADAAQSPATPAAPQGGAAPPSTGDPYADAITGHSLVSDLTFPKTIRHPDYAKTPEEDRRTIVFFTDDGEHGWLQHENTAAAILLGNRLAAAIKGCEVVILRDNLPDADLYARAHAVVFYCSGTENHPFNDEAKRMAWREAGLRGIGAVGVHWMLEAGNEEGATQVGKVFGGIFELDYSVNPMWLGKFETIPEHEVTRGVNPFEVYDEYYFNTRFPEGLGGERTTVLEAVPPKRVFLAADGPRSNNEHVRATQGQPHPIAWTYIRPCGGRSFAFTGGHFHWVLKNDDYRRLLLNGIAWSARIPIPEGGIPDTTPSDQELMAHQDSPPEKQWRPMPGQPPFDIAP